MDSRTKMEERETNFWWWLEKDAKSGLELTKPEHDLFNYITLNDATWHQHGVFWPPAGTDVLISTEDGGAVLYVDKVSTKGTWIVTTLDPDYHFGSYFMPATERFLDGFFPWLAEENYKNKSAGETWSWPTTKLFSKLSTTKKFYNFLKKE